MKNVFKLTFVALVLSLVMMLSPTQINASYMFSSITCASFPSVCKCPGGCCARGGYCGCHLL